MRSMRLTQIHALLPRCVRTRFARESDAIQGRKERNSEPPSATGHVTSDAGGSAGPVAPSAQSAESISCFLRRCWKTYSREPPKINGVASVIKAAFRALLAGREDGDVAVRPPVRLPAAPVSPSRPCAPCVPSNEPYYALCGRHVSCSEAVFNLCAVNGGGALCESLRGTGLKRRAPSGADEEGPERNILA